MRLLSRSSSLALCRLSATLALSAMLSSALATPVMDMRADDYLPMAAELKKSLNLNANQQTLWSQTETKTRNLLRERKARRERLQEATLAGAQSATAELRDLSKAIDEETTLGASEERQLREWWLTVNDALTESQRQMVVQLISEQLQRAQDNGGGARPEHKEEGGEHRSGGRRGGASMKGPGGANISLPGGGS
ncbi:hypothetical protein SAMN05192549_1037 [Duganella sacchari]|uniref:LTXXQ motif family protein n=1 Tax=Duganella sacchari TaxID=551987 RepID=A0A1M7M3G3_9BURK|nr:hypothetical protein [Duganella sacchari]SHM85215.1 hypothetical protein SAMN05192549_1037 [Duganella sacchari]